MRLLTICAAFMAILLFGACTQADLEAQADEQPIKMAVATGEICGGMMGATCDTEGDFCKMTMEAQCGAADQTGTCQPKPRFCTQQYEPVCGCDGKTYGNECSAHSKGVSAAYKGECLP